MPIATTITTKGQVTIPKEIRERLGLRSGDKVIFVTEEDKVVIKSAKTLLDFKGYFKVKRAVDFEAVRRRVKQARTRKIKEELAD